MKILQIHNQYRFGGGENIIFETTCRLLSQKGHKICLFKRNSRNIRGLKGKIRAFLTGIYSSSAKKELSAILNLEHPDVVHVHNVYPLISPSVLVACRQFDVPVVMTCHNYRLICPTGVFFDGSEICELCAGGREYWCVLKNCRKNLFESIAYALRHSITRKLRLFRDNVTLFIALTGFAKRHLVESGFKDDQIVVLGNMVFLPDSGIDPYYGEYVAFVGRISPEKGVGTLLAAASRLPQLLVKLAGDWSLMPELVQEAPANVTFIGRLTPADTATFLRKARFCVVPNIYPGTFGLVAAEAMSHGLAVIASRNGALSEVVDDGVTGLLFEPGNAEELTSKMKLLWENPDLCREMGEAARKKVIREYSEDVHYKRLMAVYEMAIELGKEMPAQGKTKYERQGDNNMAAQA